MTDNQVFVELFSILRAGIADRGIADVEVAQGNQPTQQGVPTGRFVFLYKMPDIPLGHVRRDSVYDPDTLVMTEEETQTYQTVYQVSALATQDPSDINSITAADIIRAAHGVMQSSATIARLQAVGLAILRVNELRNPVFVDDRDRFEYSPSFDFTLIRDETYRTPVSVVESVEYNIDRV